VCADLSTTPCFIRKTQSRLQNIKDHRLKLASYSHYAEEPPALPGTCAALLAQDLGKDVSLVQDKFVVACKRIIKRIIALDKLTENIHITHPLQIF